MHSKSIFDQASNKNKFPNAIFVEKLGKKLNKYLFYLQKNNFSFEFFKIIFFQMNFYELNENQPNL